MKKIWRYLKLNYELSRVSVWTINENKMIRIENELYKIT